MAHMDAGARGNRSPTYDVIFDSVSKSSFSRYKGSLKEGGLYLVTVPSVTVLFQAFWTSRRGASRSRWRERPPNLRICSSRKSLLKRGSCARSSIDAIHWNRLRRLTSMSKRGQEGARSPDRGTW